MRRNGERKNVRNVQNKIFFRDVKKLENLEVPKMNFISLKSTRLKSDIQNLGDQKSGCEIYWSVFKTFIMKQKIYLK